MKPDRKSDLIVLATVWIAALFCIAWPLAEAWLAIH